MNEAASAKHARALVKRGVLFVCTGNVFRSLTAEHALRRVLAGRQDLQIASAGTADYPHVVRPAVRAYLAAKGFDVSGHRRRTLSEAILAESGLVIAMSTDHRAFLRSRFQREALLFLEACGEQADALLDVEEAVADYRSNPAAVEAHMRATIDRIVDLAPRLAARLDELLNRGQTPVFQG